MRYKYVRTHLPFIINTFIQNKESHFRCVVGLPEGTKYIRAGHDYMGNMYMIVEHESFPDIDENSEIEEINILFEKVYYEMPNPRQPL